MVITTCQSPDGFPASSSNLQRVRVQAESGATKDPSTVVPVPETGKDNGPGLSCSVNVSTAAKKTPPSRTLLK